MQRRNQKDLSSLDPTSQEYWEEVLRREGLSMTRGMYPQRVSYGWHYRDSDKRNRVGNTPTNKVPQPLGIVKPESNVSPESKQIANNYGVSEDGYSEDSKP